MEKGKDLEHRSSRDELAEEARRVAADPADGAEMRAVGHDMEAVGTDWPDDESNAAAQAGAEAMARLYDAEEAES